MSGLVLGKRYKLSCPTRGIWIKGPPAEPASPISLDPFAIRNTGVELLLLPANSVISIEDDHEGDPFVTVGYNGKQVRMFREDIIARAELIESS